MKIKNAVIISVLLGYFAPVSSFANQEFELDKSAVSKGASVSVLDVLNGYLEEKGWNEGQNIVAGKTIFVASAYGQISVPRGSPGYIQARQNAFDKAMLNAKKQMAQYMESTIKTELQSFYSEPSKARQDAELRVKQREGLALELVRDGGSAATVDAAARTGYRSAEVIAGKSNELLRQEVGARLTGLGYDPDQPVSEQVLERVISSESFQKAVETQSKARIAGMQAFRTFENIPEGGNGEVGVIAIYSDRLGAVANAIFTGDTKSLPQAKPKAPLIQQVPPDEQLVSTFGVRQVINENGSYGLLAFAQASPTTDSPRSLQAAVEKAKLQADGLIRQYAGEITMVGQAMEAVESVQTMESGEVIAEYDEGYEESIKSVSDALSISGISMLKRWTSTHPLTGQKIAGVVASWTVDSAAAARGLQKKMAEPAGQSRAATSAGDSKGDYFQAGSEADEDAF